MSSCPVALCSCIILILSSRLRQGAPAHFSQQPSDQVVVMRQSVTLACGVHGYRGLVQWTKDGLALGGQRDLPGWPRYNLQGDVSLGEHNLHIENAQLEDDAVYECQATQITLRSRRAQVKILVSPSIPVILGAPVVTVRARTLHNLTCSSTGSKPTPQMSWYRDGELQDNSFSIKRLMEDGKRENITSVLSIIPERSDSGCIFTCRVSNAADPSGKQSSVTLNVHYAPEVSLSAHPDPALERSRVTFSCLVKANPGQVTYRWAKGQTALTGVRGQRYQTEVDRSFFGEPVSCAVTNAVGTTNASILLDVHFGPQLVTEPLPLTVDLGEDASFVCRWLGNPPFALVWSRQGSDTVLGNSETLRLRAVTQEDSGIYVCRAAVPGETEVRLTVNGPLIIQTEVEQWGVPGEQARIHCFIGSHPLPDRVVWSWRENVLESGALGRFRADTVTIRQGTTSTLSVDRSTPSDYNILYNCSAHNRFGSRTSSITLREREGLRLGVVAGATGGLAVLLVTFPVTLGSICSRRRQGRVQEGVGSSKNDVRVKVAHGDQIGTRQEEGILDPLPQDPADGYYGDRSSWRRSFSEYVSYDCRGAISPCRAEGEREGDGEVSPNPYPGSEPSQGPSHTYPVACPGRLGPFIGLVTLTRGGNLPNSLPFSSSPPPSPEYGQSHGLRMQTHV